MTASDGSYAFTGLPAGSWEGAVSGGYADGRVARGGLGGQVGSHVVSGVPLALNGAGIEYDFGHVVAPGLTALAGTVYLDAAKDGRYDANDFGVAHIQVILTGADTHGDVVRLMTRPDDDGHYRFADVPAGTCQVTAVGPARTFLAGVATAGSSGGSARGTLISQISLAQGSANPGYNFGEGIAPGCHLNARSILMLLRQGPNSTSVPVSLLRKVGAIPSHGPIAYGLPTLPAMTSRGSARIATRPEAKSSPTSVHASRTHPSGPAARPKAKHVAARP